MFSEQSGPRLNDGINSPVFALGSRLGFLDHTVVNLDSLFEDFEIVAEGTGGKNITVEGQ